MKAGGERLWRGKNNCSREEEKVKECLGGRTEEAKGILVGEGEESTSYREGRLGSACGKETKKRILENQKDKNGPAQRMLMFSERFGKKKKQIDMSWEMVTRGRLEEVPFKNWGIFRGKVFKRGVIPIKGCELTEKSRT